MTSTLSTTSVNTHNTQHTRSSSRILLTYLAAYFKGVTATPHIIHGDMMERLLLATGMVVPFAGPSPSGGAAQFGEQR